MKLATILVSVTAGLSYHNCFFTLVMNSSSYCSTANPWTVSGCQVYGQNDNQCTMGNGNNHYVAPSKRGLGWITASEVLTVNTTGTFEIYPMDQLSSKGKPMILQVQHNLDKQSYIAVSYRTVNPDNSQLISYTSVDLHGMTKQTFETSQLQLLPLYVQPDLHRLSQLRKDWTYYDATGDRILRIKTISKNCSNTPCSVVVNVTYAPLTSDPNPMYTTVPPSSMVGWTNIELPLPVTNGNANVKITGSTSSFDYMINGPYDGFLIICSPVPDIFWIDTDTSTITTTFQQYPFVEATTIGGSSSWKNCLWAFSNSTGTNRRWMLPIYTAGGVTGLTLTSNGRAFSYTVTGSVARWYILQNNKVIQSRISTDNTTALTATLDTNSASYQLPGTHVMQSIAYDANGIGYLFAYSIYYETGSTAVLVSHKLHTMIQHGCIT